MLLYYFFLLFFVSTNIFKIKELNIVKGAWDDLQVEISKKARLESAIRRAIGYGGMIHELRNMVLRIETNRLEKNSIRHKHRPSHH